MYVTVFIFPSSFSSVRTGYENNTTFFLIFHQLVRWRAYLTGAFVFSIIIDKFHKEASMPSFDLNWLAVAVAVVALMLVGGLWYGPLFGKRWIRLINKKPEELGDPGKAMAGMTLLAVFEVFILANVIGGAGAWPALRFVLWIWVGIIVPILGGFWLFEGKPLGLVFLNAGNQLLSLCAAALILGAWPQ
jgi:hypothetical protein